MATSTTPTTIRRTARATTVAHVSRSSMNRRRRPNFGWRSMPTTAGSGSANCSRRLAFNADDYSSQNQNLLYRVTEDPGFTTPYTANEYKYSIDDYFNPSFLRKIVSSTLQIDQQLNDEVALTAITAQFFSYNRGVTDFAKKPIPIDLLFQNADHRVYSQEVRLGSTGHSDLDWLVGAFAQYHGIEFNNGDWLYNADPNNPQIVGTDKDVQDKIQKQYALYGDVTYHLGSWQLELGVRGEYYTSDEKAF